jgi:single-stranded DNA-binding protein
MSGISSPNAWSLEGRLVADAVCNERKTSAGKIANFRLAVSDPSFFEGQIESRELYVNVRIFCDGIAVQAGNLKKGDRVKVIGQSIMKHNEWTDKETGEPRERWNNELHISHEFDTFGVELLDEKAAA